MYIQHLCFACDCMLNKYWIIQWKTIWLQIIQFYLISIFLPNLFHRVKRIDTYSLSFAECHDSINGFITFIPDIQPCRALEEFCLKYTWWNCTEPINQRQICKTLNSVLLQLKGIKIWFSQGVCPNISLNTV